MNNQLVDLINSAMGGNRWSGGPTSRGLGQTRGSLPGRSDEEEDPRSPQAMWGQNAGRLGSGYGGGVDPGGFQAPRVRGMNWGHRGPDGTGLAGMGGVAGPQGPHTAAYYGMGAIPTAWNSEVVKPKSYRYSGAPDMAKMIRKPWDPSSWDPELDYLPAGGGRPSFAHMPAWARGRMGMR